jgi:hypothetical protein
MCEISLLSTSFAVYRRRNGMFGKACLAKSPAPQPVFFAGASLGRVTQNRASVI